MEVDKNSELQLLRKRYSRIKFRSLIAMIFLLLYYFTIRYLIPNEDISKFLIFPVFIIVVVIVIKSKTEVNRIRKKAKEISKTSK